MTIIGSFIVVNKIVTAHFPVFLASELRLAIGAVVLISLLLTQEKRFPDISRRDSIILFFQAFIGVFLFSIFMLYGLKYTTAVESGIITSLTPAIVGIISYFILKEVLLMKQIAGIFLAILGTLLINFFGMYANIEWTITSLYGNLLILGAVMGEAVFVTFGKLVSKELSPLSISTMMSIIGSLLFLPLAIYDAATFNFSKVTMLNWLLILYSGIFVTVIAVLLMNQGLIILSAGTSAVFTAIMPISAVLFSCLFLNEIFYWYHLLGICFILLGLTLIAKSPASTDIQTTYTQPDKKSL